MGRNHWNVLLPAVLAALLAAPGGAQLRAPGAVQASLRQPTVTLLPGDDRLDGTRVQAGEWQVRIVRVVDGAQTEVGVGHYRIERAGDRMRFIQRLERPNGALTDTSLFEPRGMLPIRHRGHAPESTLTLRFEGARVTGSHVSDATVAIDESFDEPVFDGTLADVLVGALPLEPGLDVRLPIYVHRGGRIWLGVRVAGHDAEGWHVKVSFADRETFLVIDPETRRASAYRIPMPDGSELRMVRR